MVMLLWASKLAKLNSILALANLLAHIYNNLWLCYYGQIN